jgi:sugar lactone lactonase YvrE
MSMRGRGCFLLSVLGVLAGCDDVRAVDQPPEKDSGSSSPVCSDLPAAPIAAEVLLEGLTGSEDIAIDAKGKFVARRGDAVIEVLADGGTGELVATLPGKAGMRFFADGSLAVAFFDDGKVVKLSADGTTSDLVTDVGGPNGIFVDLKGRLWVTATTDGKLVVRDANGNTTDVATGLDLPNGVVYDPKRHAVFVDELGSGKILRIDESAGGNFGTPVEVASLPAQSLPDGMTLDACGNLYAMGYGSRALYRVTLGTDDAGASDVTELATFSTDVANPVFARGRAPEDIYVTGAAGTVYRLPVGVESAVNAP